MTPEQVAALGPAFAAYLRTFEGCFGQGRTREHLPTYCRGLLSDLPRKSVEPIALAAGTAVRTLQAFVKDHVWDRRAVRDQLHRGVADALADVPADDLGTVGLRDETSVVNKGKHTPGVQRPYCGAVGKQANCTVTVHLGVVRGGSKTLLDADLFLPQSWSDDRQRCRQAGIPDAGVYQPKGRLGWGQLYRALGNGIALDWLTFDEGYGCRTGFLAELDRLSDLHWVGEVPKSFRCLTARPKGLRPRGWSGKRADDLTRCSAVFHSQTWQRVTLQRQTLGPQQWEVRAAQVYLVRHREVTERTYGLIVARNVATGGGQVLRVERRAGHAVGTGAACGLHALERGTRVPGQQERTGCQPLRGAHLHGAAASLDVVPGGAGFRGWSGGPVAGGKIQR